MSLPVAGDIIRPWPLKPAANVNAFGHFIDYAVVIRRHLIEPSPTEDEFYIPELRKTPDEIGHEVIIKTLNVAIKAHADRFIGPGFGKDNLEASITAPVETTRVDRHWEFVGPRPGQCAAE